MNIAMRIKVCLNKVKKWEYIMSWIWSMCMYSQTIVTCFKTLLIFLLFNQISLPSIEVCLLI